MPVIHNIKDKSRHPVKIWTDQIHDESIDQLTAIADLDVVHGHVAAMPDVHVGKGATVGSVIPTRKAILPAAVGVDIGCGMNAVQTTLKAEDLPEGLAPVRGAIEDAVPVGFNMHHEPVDPKMARHIEYGYNTVIERAPAITGMARDVHRKMGCQLGTLGGGNHFIEVCLDETDRVWVMLHSGSRGIGNAIGRYYIEAAKDDCERRGIELPNNDLAWLAEGSPVYHGYVEAVDWAQHYAKASRDVMMRQTLWAMERVLPHFEIANMAVDCHHNYVAWETHDGVDLTITRKGAIRAGVDELGIIPGSMGAKSFIVRGKGNAESFESCSHGAGRRMSRSKAKKQISMADFEASVGGVECRRDPGVLDEAPDAYKDIDQVMAYSSDLVSIEHTLKQVVCVKG